MGCLYCNLRSETDSRPGQPSFFENYRIQVNANRETWELNKQSPCARFKMYLDVVLLIIFIDFRIASSKTHCVSLRVIAGILMSNYLSLHKMWPIKACCLFIACWHHCSQMRVWTHMIQWITIEMQYNVACIIMIIVHTADWIEKQCSDIENIFISYQL